MEILYGEKDLGNKSKRRCSLSVICIILNLHHKLFSDNYYTSIPSCFFLNRGSHSLVTVRRNRIINDLLSIDKVFSKKNTSNELY